MFNTAKSKGYLYRKLRNDKQKEEKGNRNFLQLGHIVEVSDHLTELEKATHISFFKTCVMPDQKERLKTELRKTIKFRHELMANEDLPEIFPFYFASPDMV